MTTSSVIESGRSIATKESRIKKVLAEVRQMSRVSKREGGLLNHPQAGAVLEVSTRRIGELVELGKLTRWDFLGRTYVSVREVLDRREADLKAGRPRRSVAERIRVAGKLVAGYDALNLGIDAIMPETKNRKRRPK